ncbi:MAG: amidohydrolase family protein [Candidatus Rokuibacteriota bacterium]
MTGGTRGAGATLVALVALVALLAAAATAMAGDYIGPLIDAHSHVPNATAIDAYVAAMKRHGITRVVLLGVGGVQKDDAAWIAAAAKKYPDRVVAGVPVPDPAAADAGVRLDAELKRSRARVAGEVHVRQASRKIERDPSAAPFLALLRAAAAHEAAVVIHQELDERAAAALERALVAEPKAIVVLAHAGEAPPALIETLLTRRANLRVDLSGMHFQRSPSLATETGPLDPAWKALIEKMPDRFLMGVDVWAPRLFEPRTLDRLMAWTRRVLGELRPDVAERVAWKNAAALYRVE